MAVLCTKRLQTLPTHFILYMPVYLLFSIGDEKIEYRKVFVAVCFVQQHTVLVIISSVIHSCFLYIFFGVITIAYITKASPNVSDFESPFSFNVSTFKTLHMFPLQIRFIHGCALLQFGYCLGPLQLP